MNIANKLTLLRILMILVFIFLLLNYLADQVVWLGTAIPVNQVWAAVVFALASFTDFLDGYLARKYQLVTSFGAFFDPMADKLLVMAALILLVQLGSVPGCREQITGFPCRKTNLLIRLTLCCFRRPPRLL